MTFRTSVALHVAHGAAILSRVLKQGGGTALPGLLTQHIAPSALHELAISYLAKSICVSGTNGKTTTTQLIQKGFSGREVATVHNRQGSNMERGILSALIDHHIHSPNISCSNLGIFECDEAALISILPKLKPTQLVLTNLYRDQLDRYGEVESTRQKWHEMLVLVDWPMEIIYNAADPQLHYLLTMLDNNNLNINPLLLQHSQPQLPTHHKLNSLAYIHCPKCTHQLEFLDEVLLGQGTFTCPNCHFSNSDLQPLSKEHISYNTVNISLAQLVVPEAPADHKIFGRRELVQLESQSWEIILIKNPNGAYQAIKETEHQLADAIVFALNDHYADGTDISWIWDIPLEELELPPTKYITAGTRHSDMALRLKYRDLDSVHIDSWSELKSTSQQRIIIYATYTAMLDLQNWLTTNKYKQAYWK